MHVQKNAILVFCLILSSILVKWLKALEDATGRESLLTVLHRKNINKRAYSKEVIVRLLLYRGCHLFVPTNDDPFAHIALFAPKDEAIRALEVSLPKKLPDDLYKKMLTHIMNSLEERGSEDF